MIDKLQIAVSAGEKAGADFVEARYDDLLLRTLHKITDNWKDLIVKARTGIGVTCHYQGATGYGFTASENISDIKETVVKACKLARASAPSVGLKLDFDGREAIKSNSEDSNRKLVRKHPRDVEMDQKIEMVNRAIEAAKELGQNIALVRGMYGELTGKKIHVNSDGSILDWDFLITDLRCSVTSKTVDGSMVIGADSWGGSRGMEIFEEKEHLPETMGKNAAERANEQLQAKACPAGSFRALIDSDLAGVLAHESFGHLSEADSVVTEGSPLAGKIGERLGTEQVTIIDGGKVDVLKYGGLWLPFDDQGIRCGQTVVLDKGILKHYLHNRGTAKKLGQEPTGNCRAINFAFNPIPRMTNTFFLPGDIATVEEALTELKTGIYALQSYGGQVEGSGNFMFKSVRGYWVENGEIKYPLREVSLTGNILNLLKNVTGATRKLKLVSGYFGGCGKSFQAPLPVGMGGGEMLLSDVRFGGQA